MKTFFKEKATRSKKYLAYIRELDCFACGKEGPSEPSHFGGKGKSGGMGLKADDLFTAPLCRTCHQCWHDMGRLPIPGGVSLMGHTPVSTFDAVTSRALHIEAERDALARYIRERL